MVAVKTSIHNHVHVLMYLPSCMVSNNSKMVPWRFWISVEFLNGYPDIESRAMYDIPHSSTIHCTDDSRTSCHPLKNVHYLLGAFVVCKTDGSPPFFSSSLPLTIRVEHLFPLSIYHKIASSLKPCLKSPPPLQCSTSLLPPFVLFLTV